MGPPNPMRASPGRQNLNNFVDISDINSEAKGWRGESSSGDFNCLALRGVLLERVGVPFPSPLEGPACSSVHFFHLPSYVRNSLSGSKG